MITIHLICYNNYQETHIEKTMKVFVSVILLVSVMFAKVDYSEMSTQELIAIIGYVKKDKKESFQKELKSRIPTMTPKEKAEYEKNKDKLK